MPQPQLVVKVLKHECKSCLFIVWKQIEQVNLIPHLDQQASRQLCSHLTVMTVSLLVYDIRNKEVSSLLFYNTRSPPKSWLSTHHTGSEHLLRSLQRVANQQGLLATYLPGYRHTWFQLGICTYKQLAMAAYWSGSAMLTTSQDRHKLLMNDIHSCSQAMTTQFWL